MEKEIYCAKKETGAGCWESPLLATLLPRLVELSPGEPWTINGFLEEAFGKRLKLEYVASLEDEIYILYAKGFKPTRKEVENAIKKYYSEIVEDFEKDEIEWRVWKR